MWSSTPQLMLRPLWACKASSWTDACQDWTCPRTTDVVAVVASAVAEVVASAAAEVVVSAAAVVVVSVAAVVVAVVASETAVVAVDVVDVEVSPPTPSSLLIKDLCRPSKAPR